MKQFLAFAIVIAMIFSLVPILKAEGEAKIVGILVEGQDQSNEVKIKMPKTGGKLEAKVFTENIAKLEHRAKEGNTIVQPGDYSAKFTPSVEKVDNHFKYSCTIPKNTTENDIVWTIQFKGNKWADGGKIVVTVSAKEEENPDKPGPAPEPQPTPGEEKTPEILGYDYKGNKDLKSFTITLKQEDFKSDKKNITLKVKTKNITDSKDIYVGYKIGTIFQSEDPSLSKTESSKDEFIIVIPVPKNTEEKCKNYFYKIGYMKKFNDKFPLPNYNDKVTLNVNVVGTSGKCEVNPDDNPGDKPIEKVVSIAKISDTRDIREDVLDMEVPAEGGEKLIYLTLTNGDILENNKLGVAEFKDGKMLTDSIPFKFEGKNNDRVGKLTFTENNSGKDKVYNIAITIDGKLKGGKRLTITQKAKKVEKVANIAIYSLTNENIPLSGGDVTASAFGENFDISKFSIKVFDGKVDATSSVKMDKFVGREDTASLEMKFSKVETEKVYKIKLFYDGKEVGENILKQNEYGSNNSSIDIQANRAIKIDNKIIVEFAHDIFEAYPNALKDNIEIAFDGTPKKIDKHESKYVKSEPKYEKLQAEDTVEVKDNKIIVTLAQDKKIDNMPKIRLGFRTFKNPQGVYNGRKDNAINSYFISDSKGVILSAEFLSDDVFLSSGGDVKIKINGLGLSDVPVVEKDKISTHTRVKVLKNENESDPQSITAKITGEGKEQILTFKVPENKTNRTESYTVSLSTDGRVFLSNINANIYDRANLLVVSVLPKGKNKDDITLGFARITSYGTSGGSSEVPDITHTIPPLGQESKKTWVTIFGTNLKNPMTKIRAKAEVPAGSGKYVYFYPVNEGTQDSGNKFIMVGVSKGLYGRGNVQMLEVIAPRGYRGDMLYTYEVAVDGVHFDKEITTSVLLLDDGEDGGIRKKHEAYVRDLKVRYIDVDGNAIKPDENIYIMKNQTLRSIGFTEAPKIDGYEFKKIKEFEVDISKELSTIQMLKELKKNGKISKEQLEELDRLEKFIKNNKELEFGNVVGDIPSLTFVYEKIKEDDKPTPVEPTPDYRPIEPAPSILDEDYRPHYGKAFTDESGVIVSKKEEKKVETPKPEQKEDYKILDINEPTIPVNLTDIPEGEAGDAIKNMVARGILKGMDNGKFEGELPISRAMVSTVLMRISKDKSIDNLKSFIDLKDTDWYNEAIKWAVKHGVIKGYDDNTVKANTLVSRQEFAVMIYRFLKSNGFTIEKIIDIDDAKFADVPEWSKEAVKALTEAGLINIKGDKFNPKGEFTREELAITLNKIVTLNR